MPRPEQFAVNEAWILFRLNSKTIFTDQDGDFDCLALMDAASSFILGTQLVCAAPSEPTILEAKRLFKSGEKHKQKIPVKLYIQKAVAFNSIIDIAKRLGIEVFVVSARELLPFTSDAKIGFRQYQEQSHLRSN